MRQATFSHCDVFLARCFASAFFLLIALFGNSATAELYCDPQIKARAEQDRQNAILKDIARFESAYGQANSFDSLYCGAQISSGFDQIGQNLVGGIANQINGLINQLFQKACKSAVAPIQNAASQSCTPSYTKSYFEPNLLNNAFNQNSNSQNQAANCLAALVSRNPNRDISTIEIAACLTNVLSDPDVLACLIALFSQNKSKNITISDINFCLRLASTAGAQLNYCPGTQLIQLSPLSGSSGFSGGGSSYPQLFW